MTITVSVLFDVGAGVIMSPMERCRVVIDAGSPGAIR